MAGAHDIGGAYVEIELDGKPCRLVPSLEACIEISKMGGGLAGADQRVRSLNFETICAIVGAGIEVDGQKLNPRQKAELLPKAVYEAGIFDVMAKCLEFIALIGNGGKWPSETEVEEEADDGEKGDDTNPFG